MVENTKPEDQAAKVDADSDTGWTVMVYLAGDNNLTPNCITVLQQLEAVQYKENIRVFACFDSNTPWPKGSRYLAVNGKRRLNNEKLDWEIYNDLIITEDRGHTIKAPDFCNDVEVQGTPMNRTDVAEGLRRFLAWAMKQHHVSDRCMLILYGHGPVVAGKTFLARENPLSSLPMKDLPMLLKRHFGGEKPRLDILAFQNCAMNGVETAYEVKDQVDFMIGSQGLVLSYGWPYDKILQTVVDNRNDEVKEVAGRIVKACARHLMDFSVMDRSSEQSVCDLSKLREPEEKSEQILRTITDGIRELSIELQRALGFIRIRERRESQDPEELILKYPVICDAVKIARLEAQSFWSETFVDVYDFCERLMKKCNEAVLTQQELVNDLKLDPKIKSGLSESPLITKLRRITNACMNVMTIVEKMIPYSYYIGPDLQYSRGLSIYFPWTMQGEPYSFLYNQDRNEHVLVTAFETYNSYDFVTHSGWGDFLKIYYRATLRKVRRSEREFAMKATTASVAAGIVSETYTKPSAVLTTEYLQKTDSNTGPVDYEVWSNVKNYPRRNYLSPSDCARRLDPATPAESAVYLDPKSPPVSYLGWNICELVADVIRKKEDYGTDDTTETPAEKVGYERSQPAAPADKPKP